MSSASSYKSLKRTVIWIPVAVVLCALIFVFTPPVFAKADVYSELREVRATIQELNENYDDALQRIEELNSDIAEKQEQISYIQTKLIPGQKEKAADAFETLYRLDKKSTRLIDYILSSENFYDLVSSVKYVESIYSYNREIINELLAQQEEVHILEKELEEEKAEAESQATAAEDALAEAEVSRTKIMELIAIQQAAEEAARQAALEAAAKAEAEAAAAATQKDDTDKYADTDEASNVDDHEVTDDAGSVEESASESAEEPKAEAQAEAEGEPETELESEPSSSSSGLSAIDWTVGKDTFISTWTARIDAYLSGSPLAGYGSVFAEAAWSYCVDPRLSPAISTVESGTGRNCYRPYNAWGWGGISWSSWEEAIWAHVKGLASGYGGVLTVEGAKKYCPTNPDTWYANVLSCMKKI